MGEKTEEEYKEELKKLKAKLERSYAKQFMQNCAELSAHLEKQTAVEIQSTITIAEIEQNYEHRKEEISNSNTMTELEKYRELVSSQKLKNEQIKQTKQAETQAAKTTFWK